SASCDMCSATLAHRNIDLGLDVPSSRTLSRLRRQLPALSAFHRFLGIMASLAGDPRRFDTLALQTACASLLRLMRGKMQLRCLVLLVNAQGPLGCTLYFRSLQGTLLALHEEALRQDQGLDPHRAKLHDHTLCSRASYPSGPVETRIKASYRQTAQRFW